MSKTKSTEKEEVKNEEVEKFKFEYEELERGKVTRKAITSDDNPSLQHLNSLERKAREEGIKRQQRIQGAAAKEAVKIEKEVSKKA